MTAVAGRIRALTPILRLSIAYPLRNRFRTGVTLAMFMLVVFTLVVGGTISGSFVRAFDNEEMFGGGFDVRAGSAAISPIDDPARAIATAPGLRASDFRVVSAGSYLPVQARQTGTYASKFADYPVRGVDAAFSRHTTYLLAAHARGYDDPWRALAKEPGLAIVDGFVAPRRDNWGAGQVPPDFQLHGFYLEDQVFDPVPIEVRDPQTRHDGPAEGDRRSVRPGAARDGGHHDLAGHAAERASATVSDRRSSTSTSRPESTPARRRGRSSRRSSRTACRPTRSTSCSRTPSPRAGRSTG